MSASSGTPSPSSTTEPPKRTTTGAIPLNWAMPAELTASAAGLSPKTPAARPATPRERPAFPVLVGAALVVSVTAGLAVGVFAEPIVASVEEVSPALGASLRALVGVSRDPVSVSQALEHGASTERRVDRATDDETPPVDLGDMSGKDNAGTVVARVHDVEQAVLGAEDSTVTAGTAQTAPSADTPLAADGARAEQPTAPTPSDEDLAHIEELVPSGAAVTSSGAAASTGVDETAAVGIDEGAPAAVAPASQTGLREAQSKTLSPSSAASPDPPADDVVRLTELPVRKKVRQMVTRAEGLIKAGRFDDAVLLLQRAETIDGSYPLLHRTRGIAEASRGQTEAARAAYRRYLALAPTAPDAADVRRILGE